MKPEVFQRDNSGVPTQTPGTDHGKCGICDSPFHRTVVPVWPLRAIPSSLLLCDTCGHIQKRLSDDYKPIRLVHSVDHREPSIPTAWLLAQLPRELRTASDLSVLDVGCWEGDLLAGMPNRWRRQGIEPNHVAANSARSRGLDIFVGTIDGVVLERDTYDLVTMIDVLEHLADPQSALQRMHAALKPGGYFAGLTGNGFVLSSRIWGPRWYYFNYAEHITFFSKVSLKMAAMQVGLRPITVCQVFHPMASLGRDMRKAIAYLFSRSMSSQATSETSLSLRSRLGFNATTFSRLFRGKDHLLIVARKE